MKMIDTINWIIERELCTGCGTCISLCPKGALKIEINEKKGVYIPVLDKDKCNNCGLCFKVCPGYDVKFRYLNLEIFKNIPREILVGNYVDCYIGSSTDYTIRYNSSSGGLITQLLLFALEENIIDGALVTKMKKSNPLETEPFIARTKKDILEASKSKYCPVALNISIKEILDSDPNERFAVVGLPCHIHGIRKAQQINKILKSKIKFCIGIFCNHAPNIWASRTLLRKLKVKERDVIKLDYRGKGWPGALRITKKSNSISLNDGWGFIGCYLFTPTRCLLCSDAVCELADLSFGDAWLPELSADKVGTSIMISRTNEMGKLLQNMKNMNKIYLEEIDVSKIIQSQMGMIIYKKKNPIICSKFGLIAPKYDNLLRPDTLDYFLMLFPFLSSYYSNNWIIRKILCHVPMAFIRLYNVPNHYLLLYKSKKDYEKYYK